ncbi:MAG: selenide, water dikinase SelD [Bacteroidota bacterium]
MEVKLTEYSHGAGCGCKLSPAVLDQILAGTEAKHFEGLLVGSDTKDDAAVYQIDGENSVISTTDFFMPIVDDPFNFGAIAATNAISDIYAMGGTPIMAIAILGWPINQLGPEIASEVVKGARKVCENAKIPLAGGHSIDAPEPIFGLAVTGRIKTAHLKKNSDAKAEDLIYLSKPLGIGLVSTAQKKKVSKAEDLAIALESMLTLNDLGAKIAHHEYVHAITDVTGFGLGGHLNEVCEASGLRAEIRLNTVPQFSFVNHYLELGTIPGGTVRNWESYGKHFDLEANVDHRMLADPQTSGGLLITVDPSKQWQFESVVSELGYQLSPIGRLKPTSGVEKNVTVRLQ